MDAVVSPFFTYVLLCAVWPTSHPWLDPRFVDLQVEIRLTILDFAL